MCSERSFCCQSEVLELVSKGCYKTALKKYTHMHELLFFLQFFHINRNLGCWIRKPKGHDLWVHGSICCFFLCVCPKCCTDVFYIRPHLGTTGIQFRLIGWLVQVTTVTFVLLMVFLIKRTSIKIPCPWTKGAPSTLRGSEANLHVYYLLVFLSLCHTYSTPCPPTTVFL